MRHYRWSCKVQSESHYLNNIEADHYTCTSIRLSDDPSLVNPFQMHIALSD